MLPYDDHPRVLIWELTRACALACRHCRACAQPRRHPAELTREEARSFLRQACRAQPDVFILTGGDPLMRPDLPDLVKEASDMGLRVALSPSATPRLARTDLTALKSLGVRRMSLSLDGPTPPEHDRFRGVAGAWDITFAVLSHAREAGMPIQINTTITRGNLPDFSRFHSLITSLHPAAWTVFGIIPTGRAGLSDLPEADEMENALVALHRYSQNAPFAITTTEAMHFRRVAAQQLNQDPGQLPPGTGDGRGVVFVSHTGDICPSGFLPVSGGNVRGHELVSVYRFHPLFRRLRDPHELRGKCGRCPYNRLCGGSRARAHALTGDPFQSDPLCAYQPAGKEHRP